MNNFFVNLFSLLINPPGNLVYYLLLIISIAGALQGTIAIQRFGVSPFAKRTITGLVVLLILQVIPYLISPFAWSGIGSFEPQNWMAPVDRAFSLLSLIWIAWIWIFPKPAPKADAATLILSLLTIILFGIFLVFWNQTLNPNFYNHTFQDNTWQITTLVFTLIALVVILIRRPPGYGYALASFVLAGSGHLIHLLSPGFSGYFSGIIRFTQIAMYPLLLALPQYLSEQLPISPKLISIDGENKFFQERRRFSTDPRTFNSFFILAAEADTDQVGSNITRAIAQSMLADLVFLILIDNEKKLNIACGYDLIREEVLDGTVIDKELIPRLSTAILRGRALRLPASNKSDDIQGLGQIIGISNPGNAMTVPLESSKRGSAIGSILLLSPYSNREWSASDQSYLGSITNLINPIMARSQKLAGVSRERDAALSQVAEMQNKLQAQDTWLQSSQPISEKNELTIQKLAELSTELEEARNEISHLKDENKSLSETSRGSVSNSSEIEQQFRMTLEELSHLQNELTEANSKLYDLEQNIASSSSLNSSTTIPVDQVDILTSVSQELRQPMSSIIGYVDLLLGESVGILGALQIKFLERIKASTDRISSLIHDLNQVTSIGKDHMLINPEMIDLNLIIDNAVAYTSSQLREKKITMRLDIPDSPPKIHIDREALQQIIIHLLQNAGAATLVEGTVMLRVKFHKDDGKDFLMIQVVDSGGGIATEDLPKVFAQRYRADNVLIQGLGDTGVGLSIAKTLAEAHSGRIWVETIQGEGSTISALLPFESVQPEDED